MSGYLFFVFSCLTITSADLYHGPETADSHKVDKDDFDGRHHGESLSKFITRVLQPNTEYLDKCGRTINQVAELMRSKLVPHKVAATIKGGSLGKGTAVKQMADADLLFPLGGIGSVKDLREKLPEILKTLQSALDRSGHIITSIKKTPFTIQFQISVDGVFQEVDLLPIVDLGIQHPTKENLKSIYTEMKTNENLRDYYMKCLSFLQVNFVKQQPPKVKSVIRLLKYWIKRKQHKLKSYGAELLVIKAYEDLGSPSSIREEDLAINVFGKLTDLRSLKVSWNKYFDPKKYNVPSAPYILDPACPYHNLIRQKSGGIDDKYVYLERDAKKILNVLKDQDYRSKRGEL
ncbi:2'-5'-oligoadenylate synthase 1A-like [Mytilus trossulus]|uniref:2'-5'-oligoadenylate synthase 1A-like n=1 Tax=Mytilus trossulus TaxID=6551 RepID=UPI003006F74A